MPGVKPKGEQESISPVDLVLAVTVDTGVAQALVDLREASGVVEAVRAQAGEAVDAVHAGAAVVAGVDGALVDVDVAHGACAESTKGHTTGFMLSSLVYINHLKMIKLF